MITFEDTMEEEKVVVVLYVSVAEAAEQLISELADKV